MENSSTRLLIYVMLMTLGVVLMLVGISWLMFLGLALVMLSTFFFFAKGREPQLDGILDLCNRRDRDSHFGFTHW
jgi:hypothetical protein